MKDAQVHLDRGVLMHKYTGHFWAWLMKNQKNTEEVLDKFGQWVDLCDSFANKQADEITNAFEDIGLPEIKGIVDVDPFEAAGGLQNRSGGQAPGSGKAMAVFDGDRRM